MGEGDLEDLVQFDNILLRGWRLYMSIHCIYVTPKTCNTLVCIIHVFLKAYGI